MGRGLGGRGHIPALDGLRGVAILWVMFVHFLQLDAAAGGPDAIYARAAATGRMGVDLFFVLSGFLITRILLDTRSSPSYFRAFYARRFLRIFPLYYAALAFALAIQPLVFGRTPGLAAVAENQSWFWLYASNYLVARDGWGAAGDLAHFWSLAIEEQFYLLWPLVVWLLPAGRLLAASVAILVAAPAIRLLALGAGVTGEAVYVATHLRPDGLLLGAVLALALRSADRPERWRRTALAVVGAGAAAQAVLVATGHAPGGAWPVAVKHTLVPVWCAALLYATLTAGPGSRLAAAFSAGWLRRVGTYSYAIYVFHILVRDLLARAGLTHDLVPAVGGSLLPGQLAFHLAAALASIGVAAASWHLFERRLLDLKRHFPYAPAPRTPLPRPVPRPAGDGIL